MPRQTPISPIQWWDVFVQVSENLSDIVGAYLHDLGSTAIVLHEQAELCPSATGRVAVPSKRGACCVVQGAFPADDAFTARMSALHTFLRQHATAASSPCCYCRPLRDDAYLTQWQQFFQPLQIAQRLFIRPPWDPTPVPPDMACLTLEPGMAFGTGSHPTTYLALTLLAQHVGPAPHITLLDVGCGSGILSLAGLALGAKRAIGVDTDAQAIRVATDNAALNDLQRCAHFRHGSWEAATGTFDLITANIYLGPLVNMMHPLAQRLAPQGTLILAGILAFQEGALRTALATARLRVDQRLIQDNWVALSARRDDATHGQAQRL